MRLKRWKIWALSLVLGAPLAWGEVDVALETQAKHLETLLIAPCCWRQPISEHQSPEASQMQSEIRQMLSEGKTEQQILDHYVEIRGARILSIPPQQGFNRMSFLMPIFFGVVGLAVVGTLLRKWQRHPVGKSSAAVGDEPQDAPPEHAVSDAMSRRIQKELDDMDAV